MPTPKRRTRTRNKQATIRLFLDAIGEILREEGFGGLKVNQIARHTGKDKTLITRYFKDLAGLQRAYIQEKDYWVPIFERFLLTEFDGAAEIKELFVTLMQENFDFFWNDAEMQNIILWQISQENELMTEISKAREVQGERLFHLTDPAFKGSEVNFRAVIGLLLGGIYYMVLHAKTNKSSVCGIDLNSEDDQVEVLRTIEQIITWSCQRADPNKQINESTYMINYQFELLETFAAQLSARAEQPDTSVAEPMMLNETKKLSRTIPHHVTTLATETQISSYLKLSITKLTEVCDLLYHPERKFNPDADLVAELIASLIRMYGDAVPAGIILPKLYCKKEWAGFHHKWQFIKKNLEKMKLGPFVIDIVYIPFWYFSAPGHDVSFYDFKYLKTYAAVLEWESAESLKSEDAVMDLLVGLGLNHSRFSAYYTKGIRKACSMVPESGRIKVLMEAQTIVSQVSSRTSLNFDMDKVSIVDELSHWISMELKKKHALAGDEGDDQNPLGISTNLNAGQLAFWQKLQYDHGIYDEAKLDLFSDKVSYNFKLKGGAKVTPSSVKSKLYAKLEVNYKPLEEKLEKMLDEVRRYGN